MSRGVSAEKMHIIENGVAERLFGAPVSVGEARSRLGLAEGEQVIGFVGKLALAEKFKQYAA